MMMQYCYLGAPLTAVGPFSLFLKIVSPESSRSGSDDEDPQVELDEEVENDICRVWDMSMDEVGWEGSSELTRVGRE